MTLTATVTVEVAFGQGAGVAAPAWTDISPFVLSGSTSRGAARADGALFRYEAGRMTLRLDNSDRRFDPLNLIGPYASGGVTQVLPMVQIRLRATFSAVTYDVFRGFVDSWAVDYASRNTSFCEVAATDGTKILAQFNTAAQVLQGAGERSDQRLGRIADNAGFPAVALRQFDTGDTTMQATTLASQAWTEMLLTSDSEMGEIYFDGAGKLTFRNRTAIFFDARSTVSQVTFGDGPGEIPCSEFTTAYDDTTVKNLILLARAGGAQQSASDATSQAAYLTRSYTRNDFIVEDDAVVLTQATFILSASKDPEYRVESIKVEPMQGGVWASVLARQLGDLVTVKRTFSGASMVFPSFIRGVSHTFAANKWDTRFVLQSASRYGFFQVDDPTLGLPDGTHLVYLFGATTPVDGRPVFAVNERPSATRLQWLADYAATPIYATYAAMLADNPTPKVGQMVIVGTALYFSLASGSGDTWVLWG